MSGTMADGAATKVDLGMKIAVYYYPNFTGRAEPIILMLNDAGVEYEFIRDKTGLPDGPYSHHAMPKLKITTDDGEHVYAQTTSILQFLARKIGYDGKDAERQLTFNQVASNAADIWSEVYTAKKGNSMIGVTTDGGDTFFIDRAGTWTKTLSKNLGDNEYFGGKSVCYADFAVLNVYEVVKFTFGDERAASMFSTDNLKQWIETMKARPAITAYYSSDPEPVLYDSGPFGSVKFKKES